MISEVYIPASPGALIKTYLKVIETTKAGPAKDRL